MARIMVVDDDDTFRDAIGQNLESDGHEVVPVINGNSALAALQITNVDLVISDIRMPEMNGVELLKLIRSRSAVPVILMTGFSDIVEAREAYELGANEFIAKPFKKDDMTAAIERCLNARAQGSSEEVHYCRLGIDDFVTGRTINFNVFVRLSPKKFVKLAHKGEDISIDRIQFYREKGINHLYLNRDDFRQYVGFSVRLTSVAKQSKSLTSEKRLSLVRATGEFLQEQIRHDGIDAAVYESSSAFVAAAMDLVTEDLRAMELLDALNRHCDYMLVHCVGVSLYSVMLARALAWDFPPNLFKLAMGAFFHDVGMKELDEELITKPRYSWNLADVKKYENHPLRGINILADLESIPEDVRDIVRQHHENCQSRGFPNGMKKAAIHPMAKIVSVADEFCYRTIKNPRYKFMEPAEALHDMVSNCGEQLDRRIVEALVKLFSGGKGQRASVAK